ncbi:SitI6 family double-CXXCG motif immunity protein [Archangium lansingense]|uniref:Double-CXXCG motif protein n=1 Tax=Archangium lansingense TaxID=2995310 RepID=A0ABT3ZV19_9BACT|nr:double-CXXCG motif protein [Archangium lansinium]MCY1073238.1 double-CXXCG motif protein [Archangium lansinium]
MSYFLIDEDRKSEYTWDISGTHKWRLPGIRNCPGCSVTWGTDTRAYPSVDLTPVAHLADFEEPRAEPVEEYDRMCELVQPLLPPGALLQPGAAFGPFVGKAQGRFGALVALFPWLLLVQSEALKKLQAEGLRELKGCRTQLRFRQRNSPELLELELLPVGRLHPNCLPPDRNPPCSRCGRHGITRPDDMLLDASTIPAHLDLFRLEDFSTAIVGTERFVEACHRLGLDGVTFQPLPMK